MRYYELTYLISPDLSEEELKTFSEKINSLIQDQGGILDKSSKIIKKSLAYPIKEKGSAFLKSITFYLNGEKLSSLEKSLKKDKKILRFLLLNKPLPKTTKKPLLKPEKKKIREKVELKDIEKKLEEILKE
jgi:small subunit ribosomal protein S6